MVYAEDFLDRIVEVHWGGTTLVELQGTYIGPPPPSPLVKFRLVKLLDGTTLGQNSTGQFSQLAGRTAVVPQAVPSGPLAVATNIIPTQVTASQLDLNGSGAFFVASFGGLGRPNLWYFDKNGGLIWATTGLMDDYLAMAGVANVQSTIQVCSQGVVVGTQTNVLREIGNTPLPGLSALYNRKKVRLWTNTWNWDLATGGNQSKINSSPIAVY